MDDASIWNALMKELLHAQCHTNAKSWSSSLQLLEEKKAANIYRKKKKKKKKDDVFLVQPTLEVDMFLTVLFSIKFVHCDKVWN